MLTAIIGLGLEELRLSRRQCALCRNQTARKVLLSDQNHLRCRCKIGLSLRDAGLSLVQRSEIVTIVDLDQNLARMNELVIVHQKLRDITIDVRRDRKLATCRKGIIGFDLVAGQKPVSQPDNRNDGNDQNQDRYLDRAALLAPVLLTLIVLLLVIALRCTIILLVALRHVHPLGVVPSPEGQLGFWV